MLYKNNSSRLVSLAFLPPITMVLRLTAKQFRDFFSLSKLRIEADCLIEEDDISDATRALARLEVSFRNVDDPGILGSVVCNIDHALSSQGCGSEVVFSTIIPPVNCLIWLLLHQANDRLTQDLTPLFALVVRLYEQSLYIAAGLMFKLDGVALFLSMKNNISSTSFRPYQSLFDQCLATVHAAAQEHQDVLPDAHARIEEIVHSASTCNGSNADCVSISDEDADICGSDKSCSQDSYDDEKDDNSSDNGSNFDDGDITYKISMEFVFTGI